MKTIYNKVKLNEKIYDRFKTKDGKVDILNFLKVLRENGILENDIRISNICKRLQNLHTKYCDKETFLKIILNNITHIEKIIKQDFIIPNFDEFRKNITKIYTELVEETSNAKTQEPKELKEEISKTSALKIENKKKELIKEELKKEKK